MYNMVSFKVTAILVCLYVYHSTTTAISVKNKERIHKSKLVELLKEDLDEKGYIANDEQQSAEVEDDLLDEEFADIIEEQQHKHRQQHDPWLFSSRIRQNSNGRTTSKGRRRRRTFRFRKAIDYGRRVYEKAQEHLPEMIEHGQKMYQVSQNHVPKIYESVEEHAPELMELLQKILKPANGNSSTTSEGETDGSKRTYN